MDKISLSSKITDKRAIMIASKMQVNCFSVNKFKREMAVLDFYFPLREEQSVCSADPAVAILKNAIGIYKISLSFTRSAFEEAAAAFHKVCNG